MYMHSKNYILPLHLHIFIMYLIYLYISTHIVNVNYIVFLVIFCIYIFRSLHWPIGNNLLTLKYIHLKHPLIYINMYIIDWGALIIMLIYSPLNIKYFIK